MRGGQLNNLRTAPPTARARPVAPAQALAREAIIVRVICGFCSLLIIQIVLGFRLSSLSLKRG